MRISAKSLMAAPWPTPRIGRIKGEISIASMTTAAELTFRLTEAIKMAKNSTHRLVPPMRTPALMLALMTL